MPGFDRVKCSGWRFPNELKRELEARRGRHGQPATGQGAEHHDQRREFMRDAALLGAAGALGPVSAALADEPPPETKRIRLMQIGGVCVAPQYVAETILPGEGFSDVQ